MKTIKHHAKRLHAGYYEYRGFKVVCLGYYYPEHKVAWEAVDENGGGFAHSFSLKNTKKLIDTEIDGYEND